MLRQQLYSHFGTWGGLLCELSEREGGFGACAQSPVEKQANVDVVLDEIRLTSTG